MYMVAELKKFCPHANLHFLQVDIADRWPCGLFDVVSLIDILHHIPPAGQKSIFLKAASSVRPGGLLIYKDMADRPVLHALMNRLHDLLVAKQWIHYVPIRRIDEWAAEAGLAVIHEEEILRLWYHHEVRVYARP
jgi:2-polyprenyl-3-methyl-5-hydroxy-6-metoxy-1,4-benzoquinol methylase